MQAVALARSDRRLFEGIDPKAGTCPVLALAGAPVVVRRLAAPECCTQRRDFDNKWATMFHIHPVSGFAPMSWQSWVGPVVVYRADGGDLTKDDVSVLWDFVSRLIDRYGDGPGAVVPKRHITPEALDACIATERDNNRKAAVTLKLSDQGREREVVS